MQNSRSDRYSERLVQHLLHHVGEVLHLQLGFLLGNLIDAVVGRQWRTELRNYLPESQTGVT